MGMFDWFHPDPPIGCARPECIGVLVDWQGKYNLCCLFVWKQGQLAPLDQTASEDCKLDPPRLNQIRLPQNEVIHACCGNCDRCDASAPFSIECTTDADGCWTSTKVIGQTSAGQVLEDGWVQCLNCLDAVPEVEGKGVYLCPSCKHVIFLKTELLPIRKK